MPLFQREARGEDHGLGSGSEQQLALKQLYTEQQVSFDVDNWLSAQCQPGTRVTVATEALRLAKTLEEGERIPFNMGATTVLFPVNIRERNVGATSLPAVSGAGRLRRGSWRDAVGPWAVGQALA